MPKHRDKRNKRAIVIGASMAGLLAARVLTDHFEAVTLLERDTFPEPGENRKGVPQGKHTHVLLERGREIMENYLPGLTDELTRRGAAIIADASLQIRWFQSGGYHEPGASGIAGVGVSRPTLEAAVRERVLALPNVQVREHCTAVGLATTADNSHVTGAHLVDRHAGTNEETMTADLVVDASGRGSHSPAWLEQLGYDRPPREEVRIGLGYTTCYFRRRPEDIQGLDGIVFLTTPPNTRMGVMLAQDGNRWVVTLGGYLGDHIANDCQGFLEAASVLPTTIIYDVIKNLEPLSGPTPYTFPANLRHRYDKLPRFPQGYLVLGDGLCSFNPIYGQGMTVAAQEAVALGSCLANSQGQLAKQFFAMASKIIDVPWSTAVGSDLSFAEVDGSRTPMVRFLNWYLGKLHLAAHHDSQVSIAFLNVINMLAPPPSILHPRIVWRVLQGNVRRGPQTDSASQQRVLHRT